MTLFKILYWLGIILQIVIRYPYQKARETTGKTEQHVLPTERVLLTLLTVCGVLLPLVYTFTSWLGFADYHLPLWLGWLGGFSLAAGLVIFRQGHADLAAYWSPTLQVYDEHKLMTGGIYGVIRHPMYASQWLFSIAQILLLWNWLAGPVILIAFIPFYFLRVREEEKMMLDAFGEEYREYMGRTGGVIPKFK